MLGLYRPLRTLYLMGIIGSVPCFLPYTVAVGIHAVSLCCYYQMSFSQAGSIPSLSIDSDISAGHQPSAPTTTQPSPLPERILTRIKSNPIVAVLIALATAIITLGNTLDSLRNKLMRNRAESAREKLGRIGLGFEAEDFVESARKDDLRAVKTFLAAGMKPNVADNDGRTALMEAVANDHRKIVSLLLHAKADVNQQDRWHGTALTSAILEDRVAQCRLLLGKGANAHTINDAFLTAACRLKFNFFQMLLEAGASLSKVGAKALLCAVPQDRDDARKIVEWLLDNGVDPNASDDKSTALTLAAADGRKSTVEILVNRGANINSQNHWGGDLDGFTALMLAIHRDNPELVQFLFEKRANVNVRGANGKTALIVAASSSGADVSRTINILLDRGADVDAQDERGCTALMEAASYYLMDRTDAVRVLLERNASVSKRDRDGMTALHHAARLGPNAQIAVLLMDKGADVNVKDLRNRTPLMYASQSLKGEVVRLLLQRGASVNEVDDAGKSALKFAEEYPNAYKRAETIRILKAAGAR
jgi:ankyrin repeat protein